MQAVGYEVNRHCFPLLAVPVGCGLVFPASSPPPPAVHFYLSTFMPELD